ncbi:MAG: ferritin family protein [bacterium]
MEVKIGKENIVISDFDELEVLKIAMKIETDGEKYYKSVIGKSSDARVIRTFKRLAEDEHQHFEKFKGLFEVEMRNRGIDPDGADSEEGIFTYMDSGIFSKDVEAKSVKDAVLDAQIVELRSMLFYKEILKNTKKEGSKLALNEIIEQEQMHLNILKSWEAAV